MFYFATRYGLSERTPWNKIMAHFRLCQCGKTVQMQQMQHIISLPQIMFVHMCLLSYICLNITYVLAQPPSLQFLALIHVTPASQSMKIQFRKWKGNRELGRFNVSGRTVVWHPCQGYGNIEYPPETHLRLKSRQIASLHNTHVSCPIVLKLVNLLYNWNK